MTCDLWRVLFSDCQLVVYKPFIVFQLDKVLLYVLTIKKGYHIIWSSQVMTPTTPETEKYDVLLKRIPESDADDDFLKQYSLISNSVPEGPLPPELEAALEDNTQAEKYLSNLKKRMEAWKATGLSDAMKRALELLHDNNELTSGNSEEEDEDTDGRLENFLTHLISFLFFLMESSIISSFNFERFKSLIGFNSDLILNI